MDKAKLLSALKSSGGAVQPDVEVDGLLAKLESLEQTGRYRRLVQSIESANNKSNFLASVFECTFAFQFESSGLQLKYEVKQDDAAGSSIDFLLNAACGKLIYFEARLILQDDATSQFITKQLEKSNCYQIGMVTMNDKHDELDAIVRLQNIILSKIQKKDGTPTKFLRVADNIVNIVVVDVSDLILGTIDVYDCLLATHGDPAVDKIYKRGIFGLFQEAAPGCSTQIQTIATSYEHVRNTLSGVLFLFKKRGCCVLDYKLEHYMMWNHQRIDSIRAASICAEITKAIPMRSCDSEQT